MNKWFGMNEHIICERKTSETGTHFAIDWLCRGCAVSQRKQRKA